MMRKCMSFMGIVLFLCLVASPLFAVGSEASPSAVGGVVLSLASDSASLAVSLPASGDAVSGDAVSGDAVSGDAVSGDAASSSAATLDSKTSGGADSGDGSSSDVAKSAFDLGITFGHGALSFNRFTGPGLSMTLGLTLGLSQRMELDLVSLIELVPHPFGDVVAGAEFTFALLGERSFGDNRAGIGINTYLSAGLLFSNHTPDRRYAPTYLTFSVTPIVVGSPYSGRRERFAKMGVAWNFQDNSVSMYWSIALYDYYLVGTWKDYR